MQTAVLGRVERVWLPPYSPYDEGFRREVRRVLVEQFMHALRLGLVGLRRIFGGGFGGLPAFRGVLEPVGFFVNDSQWLWAAGAVAVPASARKRLSREFVAVVAVTTTEKLLHRRVVERLVYRSLVAVSTLVRELKAAHGPQTRVDVYLVVILPPWMKASPWMLMALEAELAGLKKRLSYIQGFKVDKSGGADAFSWLAAALLRRARGLQKRVLAEMGGDVKERNVMGMVSTLVGLQALAYSMILVHRHPVLREYTLASIFLPRDEMEVVARILARAEVLIGLRREAEAAFIYKMRELVEIASRATMSVVTELLEEILPGPREEIASVLVPRSWRRMLARLAESYYRRLREELGPPAAAG